MRYLLSFLFILLAGLAIAQDWKPVNGVRSLENVFHVFENATVFYKGDYLENGVLVIKGDKIWKVGKKGSFEVPADAIKHNLEGKFIWPSFIEIYSDFGIPKAENKSSRNPQLESQKKGPYYYNESIHPETNALDLFQFDEKQAELYRKMGFGLISTVEKDGVIRGTSAVVSLNEQNEKQVVLPQSAMHYSFFKGSSKQTYPSSLMGMIALIRQAWYDAIWYGANQTETNYNASLEALGQKKELPQIVDAGNTLSILRAQKIANEFKLNFLIKGDGTDYKRIQELRTEGSSLIVPINYPKPYDVSDPFDAMRLSIQEMKEWELADYNAALLEKSDIPFVFTSDGLKSEKELFKNIQRAIEKGLPRNEAIAHFTSDVASFLKMEDRAGSIENGFLANFLVSSDTLFTSNNKLLSNWVLGKEYVIQSEGQIDVSGRYSLNIGKKQQFDLVIEDKRGKFSAKVSDKGEGDFQKAKLTVEGNRVNVVFDFDTTNYRLSGTISDSLSRIWSGKAIIQNEWTDWAAIRKVRKDEPAINQDSTKADSTHKKRFQPKIFYPNMAYGWDSVPVEPKGIVFRNATIWTNEEKGILKKHDVVIHDGKIKMVGYKINLDVMFPDIKKDLVEVDLTGKHLTSGIIDEHSHIAISRGVNESGEAVTAEVRIGDVVESDDINIYRQLAGGVTASQLLHGSANPIGGQSALIKLRWGKSPEEMKIDDADGFIKFALGENVKQSNWGDYNTVRFPQTRMGVEQVFYDAFQRADEYRDIKKIREVQKPKQRKLSAEPRVDLELEALAEILDSQRFITCHSYIQSEINMLMHVADSMKFKVNTFTHILEGYKVADKMREHGVAGSTFSDWWAYKFEVNDAIPYNGAIMHEQGVLTAFNSDDAEMARRLNQEAAKAVKYGGVSEIEAWKFVTLNPAKMLHLDDRMGSILEGKDADLVVWSDHPMSIYARAEQTYIDGICYYDIERNKELGKRNMRERERLIQLMLKAANEGQNTQKVKEKRNKNYHCDDLEQ